MLQKHNSAYTVRSRTLHIRAFVNSIRLYKKIKEGEVKKQAINKQDIRGGKMKIIQQ
jgi:hypothetical protein